MQLIQRDVLQLQVCFLLKFLAWLSHIDYLSFIIQYMQMGVARLAASRQPGAVIATKVTTFPIPELSTVHIFVKIRK